MNSDRIEKLLRAAPAVKPAPELLARLKSDIHLPAKRRVESMEEYAPSFLKRWLPALSVAIWFLGCVLILGVQSHSLTKLRQENEALRAAATEAQQTAPATSPETELTRLRAEAEEVQKLRAEIARATAQVDELKRLRAENQQLSAQLRTSQVAAAAAPQPEQDFFAKADNAKCINNLKQLGLGARLWANENNEIMPTSFDQMYPNEVPNKAIFFCPSGEGKVQYELVSPGVPETDPNVVYARCPIHNNVGLCDGSVQQLGTRLTVVVRGDGKKVIGR